MNKRHECAAHLLKTFDHDRSVRREILSLTLRQVASVLKRQGDHREIIRNVAFCCTLLESEAIKQDDVLPSPAIVDPMCEILSAAAFSFATSACSLAEEIAPVCVAIAGALATPRDTDPRYGSELWNEQHRLLNKLDRPLADLGAACPINEICEVILVVRMSIVAGGVDDDTHLSDGEDIDDDGDAAFAEALKRTGHKEPPMRGMGADEILKKNCVQANRITLAG